MLLGEIASAETLHQIHVDREAIEANVQTAVAGWRDLLNGSVTDARQMLREVLEAPLRFTPDGKALSVHRACDDGQVGRWRGATY